MQEKIKNIKTLAELQTLYAEVFGKNGTMTAKLKQMKDLDNDARAALNRENMELRELFKTRQAEIETAVMMAALESQRLDASLNPLPENRGTIHPLTQSLSDIAIILESFGYEMWTGPPAICKTRFSWKTAMLCERKHPPFKSAVWKKQARQ